VNRFRIPLLALLFTLFTTPLFAGLADDVARDLKTVSGLVIMPSGAEFLVDLDASQGIRTGDLLAVVKPGEKIIHPATGALLGTTEEFKAILQVTRVSGGYSYARPLSVQGEIARGDTVRRYGSMGAAFVDHTGGGRELYEQLRRALPALEWEPYSEGNSRAPVRKDVPLTFVLQEERLEIRGPALEPLHSYPVAAGIPAVATKAEPTPSGAIVQKKRDETVGLSFAAEFEGTVVGVEFGDFSGNGKREIAVAFPRRVEIVQIVEGKFERIQTIDLGIGRKVIGLDGGGAGAGRAELYLTAVRDGELASLVVGSKDGRYQIVQENIPWYFRSVQLPEEGAVLLGQRMGGLDADFSGPIFRVGWDGGRLVEGDEIPLPRNMNIFGFLPFESPEGEVLFLAFTPWDKLRVVRFDGEVLWESAEPFGGSEAFIERRDPTKNPADGPAVRTAFMQARMAIAPGGEILIPVNEGRRLLGSSRNFTKSRLMAMRWNGFTLEELWHTRDQSAYLADFRVADVDGDGAAEIVQALVFSKEGFRSKGRSALGLFTLP
jgi:hypothetical protein